jgi:hypothetical protein
MENSTNSNANRSFRSGSAGGSQLLNRALDSARRPATSYSTHNKMVNQQASFTIVAGR